MNKPRLIFPVLIWLCIIVAVIAWALTLPGCAAAIPPEGMCAFMYIGDTEQGASVFRYKCQPA